MWLVGNGKDFRFLAECDGKLLKETGNEENDT